MFGRSHKNFIRKLLGGREIEVGLYLLLRLCLLFLLLGFVGRRGLGVGQLGRTRVGVRVAVGSAAGGAVGSPALSARPPPRRRLGAVLAVARVHPSHVLLQLVLPLELLAAVRTQELSVVGVPTANQTPLTGLSP